MGGEGGEGEQVHGEGGGMEGSREIRGYGMRRRRVEGVACTVLLCK